MHRGDSVSYVLPRQTETRPLSPLCHYSILTHPCKIGQIERIFARRKHLQFIPKDSKKYATCDRLKFFRQYVLLKLHNARDARNQAQSRRKNSDALINNLWAMGNNHRWNGRDADEWMGVISRYLSPVMIRDEISMRWRKECGGERVRGTERAADGQTDIEGARLAIKLPMQKWAAFCARILGG